MKLSTGSVWWLQLATIATTVVVVVVDAHQQPCISPTKNFTVVLDLYASELGRCVHVCVTIPPALVPMIRMLASHSSPYIWISVFEFTLSIYKRVQRILYVRRMPRYQKPNHWNGIWKVVSFHSKRFE
jgi:hypothetical protein